MGIGRQIKSVAGRFFALPSGQGEPDVAICAMSNWSDDSDSEVQWVRPADIQTADAPIAPGLHVVIGFPHTKQASKPVGGVLDVNAMIHWGEALPDPTLVRVGLNPATQLLVEFNKNEILVPGGATTSADPYGVSGGGIWSAPRPFDQARWRLAAIATEWRRDREKAMLGTRLQKALRTIAQESRTFATLLAPYLG
jgi:hypothetical protein